MIVEPQCWKDARTAEIKRLQKIETQLLHLRGGGHLNRTQFYEQLKQLEKAINQAKFQEDWLAFRPARKMPSAKKIAAYWEQRGTPFDVQSNQPCCFACKTRSDRWNNFDRAHLVDRFLGGLDHEANLAMLCHTCHKIMPMFEVSDYQHAIDWVLSNPLLQLVKNVFDQYQVVV